MRSTLVLIFLFAIGCGGDDGPSDPGGNNPPPPPPDPTLSSVTCSLEAIADVEYEGSTRPSVAFAWSGHGVMSDATETVLDSAVVKMGAVRVQKFTGGTSGSGSLGSGDTADGANTLSVTCYRETRTGADTEGFGIFKLVTLDFSAIHFFSQEPNLTGTTVTVSGETVTLTDGQGSLTVRVGTNNIQIQDTDSGQLHYLEEVGAVPGEHLVFDSQNLPQAIEVTGDTEYQIVTVDDEQFLGDMALQWSGEARAPMPGTIKLVLYASGNPTCPEEWIPEDPDPAFNTCGDTETWPPGGPFDQTGIDHFNQFVIDTRENFQNPIIPWEPYLIEGIIADSISIQEYVESVNQLGLAIVKTQNTHVIIHTASAPFRETSQSEFLGNAPNYVFASSATAKGIFLYIYANEMQLFGSLVESDPDICSIRDHEEGGLLPECPLGEGAPSYYEFDKRAHAVVATYLARAQTQPNPFNVALPVP